MTVKKYLYLLISILPLLSCGKVEIIEEINDPISIIDNTKQQATNKHLSDSILEYIVFSRKNNLRPVFRIPSLIVSQKGTFLVSCENRDIVADKGEIDVLIARKDVNDSNWQYQTIFPNDVIKGRAMNPIFLQDKYSNRIYLFAARLGNPNKFATEHSTNEMDFVYKYSDDDGMTWSGEFSLKSKWDATEYTGVLPSASNGIQKSDGTFYIPTMVVKNSKWRSGLLIKKVNCDWMFSSITPGVGDNESTVYIDNNDSIVLDCRTNNGVRNKYFYNELDNCFSNAPDNIIESVVNLKAEIVKCVLLGKSIYLMSFANTRTNIREDLSLFASNDGITWYFICKIDNGYNRFAYSNVSCFDQKIYVVYETEKCIKLKDISIMNTTIIDTLSVVN